jgi:hypothetical protein
MSHPPAARPVIPERIREGRGDARRRAGRGWASSSIPSIPAAAVAGKGSSAASQDGALRDVAREVVGFLGAWAGTPCGTSSSPLRGRV